MGSQGSGFLGRTLGEFDGTNGAVEFGQQKARALFVEVVWVVPEAGFALFELLVPVAAFLGLNAVFVPYAHQDTFIGQGFQQGGSRVAELPVVRIEVVNQ